MCTVPTPAPSQKRPGHPVWCDPTVCTADLADVVDARGQHESRLVKVFDVTAVALRAAGPAATRTLIQVGGPYGQPTTMPVDGLIACLQLLGLVGGEARRKPAEHYEAGGWKGAGAGGGCGVECACGTTFDGFDTLAEASALLARHIEAARRAPGPRDSFPPCPDWCNADHARTLGFELVEGWREHLGVSTEIPVDNGIATVDLTRFDHIGEVGQTRVLVHCADSATPANARLMAAAVIYAAELAEAVSA